jgi:prepilin-type N-terminal cleavage/methylation domain-containing protein
MRRELTIVNRKSKIYAIGIVNRCKGLTLTEVVVASALLLIAMVPILKALTSAHVSAAIIEQKTRSLMLAQAKLEDIKARSIYSYNSSFAETDTSLDGAYLCTVSDSGSASDIRQITVEVGYDLDGSDTLEAQEVDVTLSTLVARRW